MLNDVKDVLRSFGFKEDQMSGEFIYCCSKQNIASTEPFHDIDVYANILPGEERIKLQVRFNRNNTTIMSNIIEVDFKELIARKDIVIEEYLERITIKAQKEYERNIDRV